jgi:predicted RNase H-like HicB family nuclease
MKSFTVRIYRSGTWYVAKCLELPGCISQGKTRMSALRNIGEAIELYLEAINGHKSHEPKVKFAEAAVSV